MKTIQMLKEKQSGMKKYFEDTMAGKNKSEDEFLRNYFTESTLPDVDGLELVYRDFDGFYYGYYIVSYKDMYYVLSTLGNGNYKYEGELTEFVKNQAKKENQTIEEFILSTFPFDICYVAVSYRMYLQNRADAVVKLEDSNIVLEFYYEEPANEYIIFNQADRSEPVFADEDKEIVIDKLLSLMAESIVENGEENIHLF